MPKVYNIQMEATEYDFFSKHQPELNNRLHKVYQLCVDGAEPAAGETYINYTSYVWNVFSIMMKRDKEYHRQVAEQVSLHCNSFIVDLFTTLGWH